MRYQKFPPSQQLSPFIECYFVWEGEAPEQIEVQSPPNCFCAMVFNYGDAYQAFQRADDVRVVPEAFVCGLFTSNYHLMLQGKIGMVGIVFRPSALSNFFGFPMSHLVNSRMPLTLLLGPTADYMLKDVREQTTDEGRTDLLERFLTFYLPHAKKKLTVIDEAIDYIHEQKGCVSVESIADHFGISRRYLEKKFMEKVGVSPKFYARMKRFTSLSLKIAYNEEIDWQEIVVQYGFHDQSHLVKEFLEFNKVPPTQYHLLHREMTRFVKR